MSDTMANMSDVSLKKKKKKKIPAGNEVLKETDLKLGFHQFGIDDRILMGIAEMGWSEPTLIQQQAIPFMLRGKSVMAQARTGSGKTGAFLVPLMHRVLCSKSTATSQCVRLLVLAPSKELCQQIRNMVSQLAVGCSREVRVLDLSPQLPVEHQRPLLAELPDIVVGPPRRVLSHVLAGSLNLDSLDGIVIDEADLMMAYQHNDSLQQIWRRVPRLCQFFITSATLSSSLSVINKLLFSGEDDEKLKNAVVLRLKESPLPPTSHLGQYVIKIEEFQKMLVLFSLFKLKKIMGKTIVFVNTINKGYKLRMVLGQFGIPTCLLNSELPWASRCDIIAQFNAGHYSVIIATDDAAALGKKTKNNVNLKGVEMDIESGTSRGLDFQSVSNIINFDFPPDVTSYIHRVGRTARGTCEGTALSMVSVAEHDTYLKVAACLNTMMNKGAASKKASRTNSEGVFQTYDLDMKHLEDFEYRLGDVWHSCGEGLIRQTRRKEISLQLLNSKKLMVYFQDNPGDRKLLTHDKRAHGLKTQDHLRNLPGYMTTGKFAPGKSSGGGEGAGSGVLKRPASTDRKAGGKKRSFKKRKTEGPMAGATATQKKYNAKKSDPLRSMEFSGF